MALEITSQSYVRDLGPRGFFGNVNSGSQVYNVRIEDFAQWAMTSSSSRFWGAAGNTVTNALVVRNGCGATYVTLPTSTGAIPGQDVVLAGAAAVAWAAIPAIAAAPNNAFVNVRQ